MKYEIIRVNHLVIGAGAVGLSIAESLSGISHTSTILVERHSTFGTETSSRNSQVIHAGLYYPSDSLKTKLCIRGKQLLYDLCKKKHITHSRIGKWIVSTNSLQDSILQDIHNRAKELQIPTGFISRKDVIRKEPRLKSSLVLESPTTGIINSHEFMMCLESMIIDKQGEIYYNTEISKIQKAPSSGFYAYIKGSTDTIIHADYIINSTGLFSNDLYSTYKPIKNMLHFAKGHYVGFRSKPIVSRLIYPVPDPDLKSLGIHCTLDLSGQLKFGPDIEYIKDACDYSMPTGVKEERMLEMFHKSISKYLRNVSKDDLYLDYCGIRPKLSGPLDGFQDFKIEEEDGMINLTGIESPGLTSSLAIAEFVKLNFL